MPKRKRKLTTPGPTVLTDANTKEKATTRLQALIRGYLIRKKVQIQTVGKGVISTRLRTNALSDILGAPAASLDQEKPHEIMITKVNPKQVTLELTTNQGSPDNFRKYLNSIGSNYGAVINGGYYAINGFYELNDNMPIGISRFTCNYVSDNKKYKFNRSVDTTHSFYQHTADAISEPYEEYIGLPFESRLHFKTQTPYNVKDEYAIIRITTSGGIDITELGQFDTDDKFRVFEEQAKYLMSSGPFLIKDGINVFPIERLTDPRFQYAEIEKHFQSHPGSVPPGTFYHADQPNPRSAIAITHSNELLMITLKGNENPSQREGMTLAEFATLLSQPQFDIKTALNLDGGYSACQGVFNKNQMLTPRFLKNCGDARVLPCAVVARETSTEGTSASILPTVSGDERTIRRKKLF